MTVPYSGNGAYCYTNSLYMCLRRAGADVPEPGFIECLTTMPFGAGYLRLEDGPVALLSPISVDPDAGVKRALDALGWACEDRYGGDPQEAESRLRNAVQFGPAHVGPVDMGYLSYRPSCRYEPVGDHYVAVLAVTADSVLLHDPDGYPCAVITIEEFLVAWRAESIQWKDGPYRLRSNFQRIQPTGRLEMIERTLALVREDLVADPGGPIAYGGVGALRMLSQDLRNGAGNELRASLVDFVFPLGGRRSLDASLFLQEVGLVEAATVMDSQAVLCGKAQAQAMQRRYAEVAAIVDYMADAQQRLASLL